MDLHEYLSALRRRAIAFGALAALTVSIAVLLLAFVLAASLTGPVLNHWPAAFRWTLILLAGAGVFALLFRPSLRFLGSGAASLLPDQGLAYSTRSALELSAHSHPLAAAHRKQVATDLATLRPKDVVRPETLKLHLLIALGVSLVAGIAFVTSNRVQSGAYALLHPSSKQVSLPSADVVADLSVRIVPPSYLLQADTPTSNPLVVERTLDNPTEWALLKGSRVNVTIDPRVTAEKVSLGLLVGGTATPIAARSSKTGWQSIFEAKDSGLMTVSVSVEGQELQDRSKRQMKVLVDQAPKAQLKSESSESTMVVQEGEEVPIAYRIIDDFGIKDAVLVVKRIGGPAERFRLAPSDNLRQWNGAEVIAPSRLGMQPGDVAQVYVSARDHQPDESEAEGVSDILHIEIASPETQRAAAIAGLRELLDLSLTALADRMETPLSQGDPDGKRNALVSRSTNLVAESISDFLTVGASEDPMRRSLLREMQKRVNRKLVKEARAKAAAAKQKADSALIAELEDDAITLSDLLNKAQLQDAAEIAHELTKLRREMTSMLAELRRGPDAATRQALLATLERTKHKMSRLLKKLQQMHEEVPQDFVNASDDTAKATQDALSGLGEALQQGDLEKAAQQLDNLAHQIDSITEAFEGGNTSFGNQRFGLRQRAMAEALDRLTGLSEQQRTLLDRTSAVRQDTAQRAIADSAKEGSATDSKASMNAVRLAADALSQISQRTLPGADRDTLSRAKERLSDAKQALKNGDLSEARKMAAEAVKDTDDLAHDLGISAMMFGGKGGGTVEAAKQARRARKMALDLAEKLDRSIPNLDTFATDEQQGGMQADSKTQRRSAKAASELGDLFRSEPDGSPLSMDAAKRVDAIRKSMKKAADGLARGDVVESTKHQAQAQRELLALRDELEKSSKQGGGGGGTSGQDRGGPRIDIPKTRQGTPFRRRLLDAMQDPVAPSLDSETRRYYEGLLR